MHTSTQKVSSYLFESDRSKMTQHNFVMINENKNYNIIFYLVELASLILGTDYGRWAVLAQCNKNPADGSTRYLSTR